MCKKFRRYHESVVAILILLELTLQLEESINDVKDCGGRNPYFIGINSAIIFQE